MTTLSPNMGLQISTVGVDSGLTWENNLNSSLTTLDGHNHSSGSGVQINPLGININQNLAFNGFHASSVGALVLTPQASLSNLSAVYSIGADLYYNDANGNVVRITSGGLVNATSSGISSGAANASFVASVLVVDSAANTPANIQGGSLLLGNIVASSKFLTLSPPNAMGSNYTLTLPALPASQSFMSVDTSGNITGYASVSAGITGSNIATQTITNVNILPATITSGEIALGTIDAANIASQTLTQGLLALRSVGTSVSAGGVGLATRSGTPTAPGSWATIANQSVTVTTTGRPVQVMLISAANVFGGSSSFTLTQASMSNSPTAYLELRIQRNASTIWQTFMGLNITSGVGTTFQIIFPCGVVNHLDCTPPAGNNTWTLQWQSTVGNVEVNNVQLVAYEI